MKILPTVKPDFIELRKLVKLAESFIERIGRCKDANRLIDVNRLEEQCSDQPDLVDQIGEFIAEVRYIEKAAEVHMAAIESAVTSDIRNNPQKYKIERVVNDAIVEARNALNQYKVAKLMMVEIDKFHAIAKNAMNTFEHRRSMLRVEERLYNGEYFRIDEPAHLARRIKNKKTDNKRTSIVDQRKERNREAAEEDAEESGDS